MDSDAGGGRQVNTDGGPHINADRHSGADGHAYDFAKCAHPDTNPDGDAGNHCDSISNLHAVPDLHSLSNVHGQRDSD